MEIEATGAAVVQQIPCTESQAVLAFGHLGQRIRHRTCLVTAVGCTEIVVDDEGLVATLTRTSVVVELSYTSVGEAIGKPYERNTASEDTDTTADNDSTVAQHVIAEAETR